jgi:hypothetical protein
MISVTSNSIKPFVYCLRKTFNDKYLADSLAFLIAIKLHADLSQFALTSKGVVYEGNVYDENMEMMKGCDYFINLVQHFGEGVILSTAVKIWEYVNSGDNNVKFDDMERELIERFVK